MKHKVLIAVLGALILMVGALYNGYPFVNNDTATYIFCGFDFYISPDRPPYYGLFIRHTSLWTSLWFTIFAQCLLLSILITHLIKLLIGENILGLTKFLSIFILLVTVTPVIWSLDQLMPDAFTGIMLIALLLFMLGDFKWYYYLILAFILWMSCVFHNSHMLILAISSLLLFLFSYRKNWPGLRKKVLILLSISLFSGFTMAGISLIRGEGFTLSKGSHVFMMGKLFETGVLKEYLKDNCSSHNYQLCNHIDDLQGRSWDFIWNADGPFYKTGGWEDSKQEYEEIISEILTTPRYAGMFAIKSLISTLRQITQITIADKIPPVGKGSSLDHSIEVFFEDERTEFLSSRQSEGSLSGATFNIIYIFFFIVSSLIILNKEQIINSNLIKAYIITILFIMINAFVTATFANVLDRLQTRVFWVLPFLNIIVLFRKYIIQQSQSKPDIKIAKE